MAIKSVLRIIFWKTKISIYCRLYCKLYSLYFILQFTWINSGWMNVKLSEFPRQFVCNNSGSTQSNFPIIYLSISFFSVPYFLLCGTYDTCHTVQLLINKICVYLSYCSNSTTFLSLYWIIARNNCVKMLATLLN